MPTYRYKDEQSSSISFTNDTNPQKLNISGINGALNNADITAKGVRGLMYLGGVGMFNEYDPVEAIQNLKKGFEEVV